MKKREIQSQLDELADACARLASHAEVVALAVRSRESVPADDLDDAIDGLHELYSELHDVAPRA